MVNDIWGKSEADDNAKESLSSVTEIDCLKLSDEQHEIFIEVIGAALNIKHKTQLFRWTQGLFQYLIGHDVMIYANKSNTALFQFQYLASTLSFKQEHLTKVTEETGLLTKAVEQWQKTGMPLLVTNQLTAGTYQQYQVMNADAAQLASSGMGDFVLHGFSNKSSMVVFGGLHKTASPELAHIIELIMPYLHNVIANLVHEYGYHDYQESTANYKRLSRRETEIIQWVHVGKSNRDIAELLNISPLTVKNHVQNIIKKLAVQNRRQAAEKALKLSLFEVIA